MYNQNPLLSLVTPTSIAITLAGLTGGALITRAAMASALPVPLDPAKNNEIPGKTYDINGIYAEAATVAASQNAAQYLRLPVGLANNREDYELMLSQGLPMASLTPGLAVRSKDGDVIPLGSLFAMGDGNVGFVVDKDQPQVADALITFADGTPAGALAQVLRLVTNLTGDATDAVFNQAKVQALQQNDVFDEPSHATDTLIRGLLVKMKPDESWPTSTADLAATDPLRHVWQGMELVAALAYQAAYVEQYGQGG